MNESVLDIRLCLAFWWQEPASDTGEDNYNETDDDAPAKVNKRR